MSRARTLANFVGGTSTIVGNPTFTGTTVGAGKVAQIKQTIFKGQFSSSASLTAGQEEVVTGLNCTITPTSASNKILVQYSIHMGGTTFYDNAINIYRNVTANSGAHPLGTKLLDASGAAIEGTAVGSRPSSTGVVTLYDGATEVYKLVPVSLIVLDHPNSTSALTYSIAVRSYVYSNSSFIFINRSHAFQVSANLYDNCPVSTITLMEVS
jgi:hypothetical protein